MIHDSLCLDYPNIALSITYTSNPSYNNKFLSIYKSLYDNNKTHDHSVLIKDVISAIGADNYMMQNIKIVVPIIENLIEENGFYDNKRKLIYLPFNNFDFKEQSIFIHEASHYLMHDLFKNDGKPFPSSDNKTMYSYEKAAMNSLLSIASIVGFKYENGLPLSHNSVNVANDLHFLSLLPFFHFMNVLSTDLYKGDERDWILNEVVDILELNSTMIETQGAEKVANKLKERLIIEYNITTDQLYMIERVGEYVNRGNPRAYYNELIVRLPELIVKELDESALNHFIELQNYWLENISPAIFESINNLEIKECDFCPVKSYEDSCLQQDITC
jgi:hypothetical protein